MMKYISCSILSIMTSYGSQKLLLHMTSSYTVVVISTIIITILINYAIFQKIDKPMRYIISIILFLSFVVPMQAQYRTLVQNPELTGEVYYNVYNAEQNTPVHTYTADKRWGGNYGAQHTLVFGLVESDSIYVSSKYTDIYTYQEWDSVKVSPLKDVYLGLNFVVDTSRYLIFSNHTYGRWRGCMALGSLSSIYNDPWTAYEGLQASHFEWEGDDEECVKIHFTNSRKDFILVTFDKEGFVSIVMIFESKSIEQDVIINKTYEIHFRTSHVFQYNRQLSQFFR